MTRRLFAWLFAQGRSALPPIRLLPKPATFVLPLFTVTSALIALLVWFRPSDLARLESQLPLSLGAGLMFAGAAMHLFPASRHCHKLDIFLTGTVLVWLEYWQRAYTLDKPVYQYYPVLFALASLWVPRLAADPARSELRLVYRYAQRFSASLLAVIAVSVFLPQYYVLYPGAVLLLLIYVALVSRLETQPIVLLCSADDESVKAVGRYLERNYGPTQTLLPSGKREQPFFSRSREVPISDSHGSEHLRHLLDRCLVVLFCLNDDESDPLRPVLDRALSVLSHRRIAVFQVGQLASLPALPLDVMRLRARAGQGGVRAQLDAWLRQHLQLLPDGGP